MIQSTLRTKKLQAFQQLLKLLRTHREVRTQADSLCIAAIQIFSARKTTTLAFSL
jgi:hypothetical protein